MRSIVLAAALLAAGPAGAQGPFGVRIGVAGGVKGLVTAYPPVPKPVGRVLSSGQPLYLNERIATGPSGSLQVMLLDETVFTLGPNSSLVLDEFIYDPQSRSGKVTASVKEGVFRFVTGQIGHKKPSDMNVKLPMGTMGIRGTIVVGEVTRAGATAVLLGPGPATNAAAERVGAFSFENEGGRVDVVRPGYATHVSASDKAPSRPALLVASQLAHLLEGLAPAPQAAVPGAVGGATPAAPAPDVSSAPSGDSSGMSADAGSGSSATDDSGQSTAGASGDLSDTKSVSDLSSSLSDDEIAALNTQSEGDLETFIANNQASWDDVRTITSGTGQYAGSGNFTLGQCGAGACANANGPQGTMDFLFNVDFGAKTVGGNAYGTNSHVTVNANDAALSAPVQATVTFPSTSFAALTGPAAMTQTSPKLTATVAILNYGGTAATAGAVAYYADAAGTTGSGAVIAPRVNCAGGGCH